MKQKKKRTIDIQFVTASISTALVLTLLGIVALFILTADRLSTHVKENLTLSVVLNDESNETAISGLQKRIGVKEWCRSSEYIGKDDVLQRWIDEMGSDPSELLGDVNPFEGSIEIHLVADYACSDSLKQIEALLKKELLVKEVSYPGDLVDIINNNLRKISIAIVALALVLLLISFALINNTIKLTIYSQRFLLHTMKLVGAGWGFIRRPFLKRNAWIGFTAAVLACLLLAAGAWAIWKYEPALAGLFDTQYALVVGAGLFVFGILITLVCAHLSLNRFLRMKAGDLYYI